MRHLGPVEGRPDFVMSLRPASRSHVSRPDFRHVSHWTSEFSRKLVGSSLGREVYDFSEMAGHVALLEEFYAPFADTPPATAGMEDCESFSTS